MPSLEELLTRRREYDRKMLEKAAELTGICEDLIRSTNVLLRDLGDRPMNKNQHSEVLSPRPE